MSAQPPATRLMITDKTIQAARTRLDDRAFQFWCGQSVPPKALADHNYLLLITLSHSSDDQKLKKHRRPIRSIVPHTAHSRQTLSLSYQIWDNVLFRLQDGQRVLSAG